jgi:hypothetical protein
MSIQYHISIFFLLAMQISLIAQKDTSFQTIRQEIGEYQAPVIEMPSDRLFRTRVPSKWMFKMNLAQTFSFWNNDLQTPNGTPLVIGAEYKISPALSVGAYYRMQLGYQPESDFQGKSSWIYSASLAVEGRWYHDMKKRIKAGRGANNFGGRYLGLEGTAFNNSWAGFWGYKRLALRYGLQQRFLRMGYLDISIGAGIIEKSPYASAAIITDQRVAVGLAAFLPKLRKTTQNGNLCDVLHCQDEQYKMWKINVFDMVDFQSNGNVYNFEFQPNVAFEHKLGRTPFSVELDIEMLNHWGKLKYYNSIDQKYNTYQNNSLTWNTTAELRWYYNMRKRILKGQSGYNLSGAFFGLQINRYDMVKNKVKIKSEDAPTVIEARDRRNYWTSNIVWGIQQRILDHGFIQFKIGAGSTFGGHNYKYTGPGQPLTKIGRDNELNIVGELKVGFAF